VLIVLCRQGRGRVKAGQGKGACGGSVAVLLGRKSAAVQRPLSRHSLQQHEPPPAAHAPRTRGCVLVDEGGGGGAVDHRQGVELIKDAVLKDRREGARGGRHGGEHLINEGVQRINDTVLRDRQVKRWLVRDRRQGRRKQA
jgi:hypothetical protein